MEIGSTAISKDNTACLKLIKRNPEQTIKRVIWSCTLVSSKYFYRDN